MYQIQLLNSDGSVSSIYDQSRMNERSVSAPACNQNVNEAGTLEFTLIKNHPLINTLEPLSSFVNVLDDGEEIFYGRVLKRSDPTLTGMVTFSCEGALTFLLDSEVPPDGKDRNGNQITRHLTAEAFFRWCIETHNSEVNDPRRQFTVGTVNANQRNKEDDYSITSYTQTKTAIENQIIDVYGGFIRIRPKNGGGHYIDWIQDYETLNPQPVQIGTNVEDQTNETDGSNLFTVLRPIGKDGITLDTPTIDLYPAAQMNKIGRIVKPIEFKSATTKAELQTQANDYKQRMEKTLFINSHVQLVDMHYLDGTKPKIRIGDRFNNIHGLEGTEVVVATLELHFEAPQNDTLELKNRKSLDPDLTPEGNRHKGNGYTKKGSKKQSQYFKYLKETGDMLEVLAPQVYMHGETLTQHYQRIEQQAGYYESLSSRAQNAEEVISSHTEKINNVEQTIRDVVGTARLQDNYTLTDIVGKFEIWEDENGHVTVHLKDGAAMTLDDTNGQTITVGTRLSEVYNSTNGLNQFVQNFQGSTLWTQRNNITGIVGHFTEVDTVVPDPDHPGQYKTVKKLVVESGGGFQIREDGVEYGLYMTPASAYNEVSLAPGANPYAKGLYEKRANGTFVLTQDTTVQSGKKYYKRGGSAVLTAGMIVDKINDETVTKIRGDRVDVQAQHVTIRAGQSLDSVVGHFEEEEYLMEDGSHHPIINPETGEQMVGKRLVYKADGGMRVRRLNNDGMETEFGVYDDGNLTGGVMVQKINGQTTTYIRGNKILIGVDNNSEVMSSWAEGVDSGVAVAYLVAGRMDTAEANIQDLKATQASFNRIYTVSGSAATLTSNYIVVLTGGYIATPAVRMSNEDYKPFTFHFGSASQKVLGTSYTIPGVGVYSQIRIGLKATELTGTDAGKIKIEFESSPSGYSSGNGRDGNGGAVFSIAATQAYKDGVAASWNSYRQAMTVPVTDIGGIVSANMSVIRPNVYGNDQNETFTYTLNANASCQLTGVSQTVHAVELKYGDNVVARIDVENWITSAYKSGWNTMRDGVNPPTSDIGAITNNSISFTKYKADGATSNPDTFNYTLYANASCQLSGVSQTVHAVELKYGNNVVARIDVETWITSAYKSGWNAMRNGVNPPTTDIGAITKGSISFTKYKADGATSNPDTYTYALNANASCQLTGVSQTVHAVELKYGSSVVARIDVETWITSAYNSGWNAMRNGVNPPTSDIGAITQGSMSFTKYKANGVTSNPDTFTYTLNANASCQLTGVSQTVHAVELKYGNNVVARISVETWITSAYNSGWNAMRNGVVMPTTDIGAITQGSATFTRYKANGATSNPDTYTYMLYANSSCQLSGVSQRVHAVELKYGNNVVARISVENWVAGAYDSGYYNGYDEGYDDAPKAGTTDITSHYGRTYAGGSAGTIVEVYAAASDGLSQDSHTLYLYLTYDNNYFYVTKNGYTANNSTIIGKMAIQNVMPSKSITYERRSGVSSYVYRAKLTLFGVTYYGDYFEAKSQL